MRLITSDNYVYNTGTTSELSTAHCHIGKLFIISIRLNNPMYTLF